MLGLMLDLMRGDLKLKRIAKGAWTVYGKPELREKMQRRAEKSFMRHLMTKHPEWFTTSRTQGPALHINLGKTPPLVILLAMFYALKCAVKNSKCTHKA